MTISDPVQLESTKSKPQNTSKNIFKRSVRVEALSLFFAIVTIIVIYFTFFFTLHLKWIAEKALTQIYGAEVNISSLSLGLKPIKLTIKRLQFTNHQKPSHNLFEIGSIDFELNPEDLLFLSIVSEKADVTGIMVDTKRSKRGSVSPESQKLVSMSLDLKKNKNTVLQKKSEGNILENILSFSKSKNLDSEIEKLSEEFKLNELSKKYELKLKKHSETLKEYENFLKTNHLEDIQNEFKSLETKAKNHVNDPIKGLALIDDSKKFLKKIKSKKDDVFKIKSQFEKQILEVKNLKSEFDQDLKEKKIELMNKFKIPDISPESLANDFFAETVKTRFYLFHFWLEQFRKKSESKIQNVTQKVLSEKNSELIQDKAKAYLESSKKEKAIKIEIQNSKKLNNQIIHFGHHVRPKFWVKKSLIQANAKGNQDLTDFHGEILDFASDQKLINKPILIHFQGNLPKEDIKNIKIEAQINHHVQNLNEKFNIEADYPISSFKMINDNSLKFFLNKARVSTKIKGELFKNKVNDLSFKSNLTSVDLFFDSSKNEIENLLKPIIDNISKFNLDVFLNGPISKPKIKILCSMTDHIFEGIKKQLSSKLNEFRTKFDSKVFLEVSKLKSKLFESQDKKITQISSNLDLIDKSLLKQDKAVSDFVQKNTSKSINPFADKLKNKLFK